MSTNAVGPDELRGFSAAARRAIAQAEIEARALGHGHVGTEHLLLGLLGGDSGGDAAFRVLTDAGTTLAAARHKVLEAVGAPPSARPSREPLLRTARAERALGRAVRFSHARRADAVGSEHVLLGVLDVEGTAGQVLRSLGLDLEHVRAALDAVVPPGAIDGGRPVDEVTGTPPPVCPSCAAVLDNELVYSVVIAQGSTATRDAVVFSCGVCGVVLGVAPASAG